MSLNSTEIRFRKGEIFEANFSKSLDPSLGTANFWSHHCINLMKFIRVNIVLSNILALFEVPLQIYFFIFSKFTWSLFLKLSQLLEPTLMEHKESICCLGSYLHLVPICSIRIFSRNRKLSKKTSRKKSSIALQEPQFLYPQTRVTE